MSHRTLVLAGLIVLPALALSANTLTVTSLANSGPGSLRDQVAASISGDTIQFATNGTIVLTAVIAINHTLWVQGPGASKLTVSGSSATRIFITSGNSVVLSGMTLQDGLFAAQPGVDGGLCSDGTPGGDAFGGAIFAGVNSSDTLILSNCWLTGNIARGGQGGRGGDGGTPVCVAGKGGAGGFAFGGALYISAGYADAINCTFSDNHAFGGRGGDGGNNLGQPTAAGAGGNGGSGAGGGANVSNANGTPGFTNCTFSGNSAVGGDGGDGGTNIVAFPGGNGGNGGSGECGAITLQIKYSIISCTIVSNSAVAGSGGAGGFGVPPGSSGAPGLGTAGGICGYAMLGCVGEMGNTILADNFATTVQSNAYINAVDLGFNYVGDNDYFNTCSPPQPNTRIGTVPAPLHPQLGPLAQNGGGLPTHAPLQGSPVIDWGNSLGTTTDERHAPRPVGFPLVSSGDGSDIGAFEFGSTPLGMSIGGTNGTQVLITWPAYYGDFTLQSSSNLFAPDSWMSVTDMPAVVGDSFVVTNVPFGAVRFYRLVHP